MLGIERGCELEIAPRLGRQDHLLLERDGIAVGGLVRGRGVIDLDLGPTERCCADRVARPGGLRLGCRRGDHAFEVERRNVLRSESRRVGVRDIACDDRIALARMGEPSCRKCKDEHSAEHS